MLYFTFYVLVCFVNRKGIKRNQINCNAKICECFFKCKLSAGLSTERRLGSHTLLVCTSHWQQRLFFTHESDSVYQTTLYRIFQYFRFCVCWKCLIFLKFHSYRMDAEPFVCILICFCYIYFIWFFHFIEYTRHNWALYSIHRYMWHRKYTIQPSGADSSGP